MQGIRDILYASFDRKLSAEEKTFLEKGLSLSAELRKEKEQIQALRAALGAIDVETQSISEAVIPLLKPRKPRIRKIARYLHRIAASLFFILGLSLFTIYSNEGSLDLDAMIGLEDISAEEAATFLASDYAYNE